MTEATVVEWLKAPGDVVEKAEPLVEVETEKANAEVEAPAAGILGQILHEAGAVVEVGNPLVMLQVEGDAGDAQPAAAPAAAAPEPPAAAPVAADTNVVSPAAASPPSGGPKPARASPVARRIAAELGVDLSLVAATGTRGLISESDVRAAAATTDPQAETSSLPSPQKEPLTGRRKAIGDALSRDLGSSPQVTLTRAADTSGVQELRATSSGADYSVNDLLIATTAATLAKHPALNAHLVKNEIWRFGEINIGIAVDLEGGLIVPVLRDVGSLSLDQIRSERLRLVDDVRTGSTQPAELMDGTFTISNLGAWGIDAFTPIINPPQVAILGVGRMSERPAIVDGQLAARSEMVFSLTFDHRALDGRAGAEFLAELCEPLASARDLGAVAGLPVDPSS